MFQWRTPEPFLFKRTTLIQCFLLVSILQRGVNTRLLNGMFMEADSSDRLLKIYKTQHNLRSCAECAYVCLDDADRDQTCHAFGCDATMKIMCTFYSKGDSELSPPGVQIFVFQAHDVFHNVEVEGKKFSIYLSSITGTFPQARALCNAMGAYLLQYDSQDEYEAVNDISYRQFNGAALIGISDAATEGTWLTDREGAPLSSGVYLWDDDEPNGGSWENCANVWLFGGRLNDTPCTYRRHYLCERDV